MFDCVLKMGSLPHFFFSFPGYHLNDKCLKTVFIVSLMVRL